jgi:hypothetical protein
LANSQLNEVTSSSAIPLRNCGWTNRCESRWTPISGGENHLCA